MAFGKNVEIYIDPPNNLDHAINAIKELAAKSQSEGGCILFKYAQNRDDPRHIFMWEIFTDLDAFKEHHKQQHTIDFIAKKLFRKIASINLDIDI